MNAIWGELSFAEVNSVNQQKQQKINRSLVIRLLRRMGLCSRAELASQSGLQRATITNIINEFLSCGLVVEDGLLEGSKGRRAIGLRLNDTRFRVLGVMVTRTHYSLSMMGLSGRIFEIRTFEIAEHLQAEQIIREMCAHMREMIQSAPEAEILAICIAMPGPYKTDAGGEIVFVTNLIGWDGIPMYDMLQREFDIPVLVENDANAAACAQVWFSREGADSQHMAYVVAGQGIGCGICVGGKLLKGSTGIAGEIGHTSINFDGPRCECGNFGCLELYCSELKLMTRLQERIEAGAMTQLHPGFTMEDISAAIYAGDALALAEFRRIGRLLAVGIVNLVNQLNPELVIVGDSLVDLHPDMMLELVSEEVRRRVRPMVWEKLTLTVTHLAYNPILMGAGTVAAELVFDDPIAFAQHRRPAYRI